MQVLSPLGGWHSLYTHVHTYRGECAAVQPSPGSHRAFQVSMGISFLDSKQVLHAPWGHELGILYTTVLRELRLWQPTPGSASVAGGVSLWAGSGGTSRMLLLSVESSRSARVTPAEGRGCSRHRGDTPSLTPSPGVGGLASAGSKASSSIGGDRGVSAAWWVGLAPGKMEGDRTGKCLSCWNVPTEAVALLCSLLTLATVTAIMAQGAGGQL